MTLIQGDAQEMLAEESAFDAVIFNLILSVIPDPVACLKGKFAFPETRRPGGCLR